MAEQTEQSKLKQQIVLYDIVDQDFRWSNIYPLGGIRPNAKYIAKQYECRLEFRESRFIQVPQRYDFNLLDMVGKDGSCTAAVLVGEDREKLFKAKLDIHRTFGVSSYDSGRVNISDEKPILS